jgi:tripartite-type tricarboxylate transporter receptor subunit TctC
MRHCLSLTVAAAVIAVTAASSGPAQAATGKDYYNGKTVRWIVSTGTGGGHDYYARLFARHMEKMLPGSTFVILNRPGAGHVIGANLIYQAEPNGLTIGNFTTGLIYAQVQKLRGIRFDLAKMSWIGKSGTDIRVVSVAKTGEFQTFDKLVNAKRQIKFSASGAGTGAYMDSFMFGEAWKIPYRIIVGYQGPEAALGMMRGETDALFGSLSSGMEYVRSGQTKVILRFGESEQFKDMMKDVPNAFDAAKTPQQKALANLMVNYGQLSRIVAGPPQIVPDRLKALRTAYMDAAKSSELIKEAKASHRRIEPLNGEQTGKVVTDMLTQPPEIVAMLTALTKVKVAMEKHDGKVVEVKDDGRSIVIDHKGQKMTAKVSGSRTKITVDGKGAKRKAVQVGMACTFTWPKVNSEAQKIDCKK